MSDYKQSRLYEFFEITTRPTWLVELRQILKSQKQDIWDIDVIKLLEEYKTKIDLEKDLNRMAKAMLICTIILKRKSQRIGIRELEREIEEEIEDIQETPEIKEEIFDKITEDTSQLSLDKFAKELEKLTGERKRKKYPKVKKEIYIPHSTETFEESGRKLLDYFSNSESKTFYYSKVKNNFKSENNLFMTLMYMHSNEDIKISQNKFYEDIKIRVK